MNKIIPFPSFKDLPEEIYICLSNILKINYENEKNKFNKKSKNIFYKLLNKNFDIIEKKKKYSNIFFQTLKYHISKAKIIKDILNKLLCIKFLLNALDENNYNNDINDWIICHLNIIKYNINLNTFIKNEDIIKEEIDFLNEFIENVEIIELKNLIKDFLDNFFNDDKIDEIDEIDYDIYYNKCESLFNSTNNNKKYILFINKCKEYINIDYLKNRDSVKEFYDVFINNIYNKNENISN